MATIEHVNTRRKVECVMPCYVSHGQQMRSEEIAFWTKDAVRYCPQDGWREVREVKEEKEEKWVDVNKAGGA